MAAIITTNLRFHNSEQFVEAFEESANTIMYVFIAKSTAWENNLDSTGAVPVRIDNTELSYKLYDEMIAMKRVLSTDVNYVVPRYDWVSGTVYNAYDHAANTLFNPDLTSRVSSSGVVERSQQPFYVFDGSSYNVYKCLSNSKGAPSTVRPEGESANVITMGDGYQWKYMYTIPVGTRPRFVNSDFMYVADTNYSANIDGAIDIITVTNTGTGYTSSPNVIISGDGTGATANVTLNGNTVSNVTVINRGSGYRYANIVITGGGGTNAAARAIINPKGGHASNARLELGGYYVMLAPQLINEEEGIFPIDNDFRILGLIKDPVSYGSGEIAAGLLFSTRKNLYLSNVLGSFVVDEYITGGNSKANAIVTTISADTVNSKSNVKYFQASGFTANANSFSVGDTVTGVTSGATGNVLSIINEDIKPDSGQILYVDSFRPIKRAIDQTETVQLVIEF